MIATDIAIQDASLDEILKRVRGEYLEMPGLSLTTAQAQRLWGLERTVCEGLLTVLVDAKFLHLTRDGAFVRTDKEAAGSRFHGSKVP